MMFIFFSQSDKNAGCYDNLYVSSTYEGENWGIGIYSALLPLF